VNDLTSAVNALHHEWALPGVLAVFVVALVQVAYVLLSKKEIVVTAQYLRIREVLAGTFRRTLLREVRAVFKAVEEYLPATLIRRGPGEGDRSRFDLLAEGLRELDEEDGDARDAQRVLRNMLAGVLIGRVDALIAEAEADLDPTDPGDRPRLHVSFAESTVDDFVYLARALRLTRRHQHRFRVGRRWARRLLHFLIPAYAVLIVAMLVPNEWAYWIAVAALSVVLVGGLGSLVASSVAIRAQSWLEEKADSPDPTKLFESELHQS
jgi:hypothetical protein